MNPVSLAIPAVPLVAGGLIYTLWRTPSLLMFDWFRFLGLGPAVDAARAACIDVSPHLPRWLLYSFPDGAWASAGVLLFAAIWSRSCHPLRHFWIMLCPALAVGGELAQFVGYVPGTFDSSDLVVCAVASALAIYISKRAFSYVI